MPIVVLPRLTAPAAPILLSVTPGDSGAAAAWTPPTSDGGSAITGYVLRVSVASSGALALTVSAPADATGASIAPLVNDVQYSVTLAAVNGVGSSAPSDPVLVTATSGLPGVDPPDGPPPFVPAPQPSLAAFPAERVFRPANWLLSAEEATL